MKPGDKRKHNGRPRAEIDMVLVRELLSQGVDKSEVARRVGVSRPTLNRNLAGGKVRQRKVWDGEVHAGVMDVGQGFGAGGVKG